MLTKWTMTIHPWGSLVNAMQVLSQCLEDLTMHGEIPAADVSLVEQVAASLSPPPTARQYRDPGVVVTPQINPVLWVFPVLLIG